MLKKVKGILAEPDMKRGRALDEDIARRVVEFYQCDEHSRVCPGKKEYVSVKVNGTKEQMQKRLLLTNLKEMHIQYGIKNPNDKIGFSKFAELRPKWCVPVSAAGTHSVCVGESHQNAKLMVTAIPHCNDYKEILGKLVCDVNSRQCMLHLCESCPGKPGLSEFLTELFTSNDFDQDDEVSFKQWPHADRATLISLRETVQDFIDQVCDSFDGLRQHHFIRKAQSSYLTNLKENLSISNCLKHDTTAVHAFQSKFVGHIKAILPSVKKLIYFSDGAASQYKNYKNLSNLCWHVRYHQLEAEWHFFATSHRKSPCDGIGGTVKRLVARASLQATVENHILTAEQMYEYSNTNISGMKFFYVSENDVLQNLSKFDPTKRFASSKTFVPVSESRCAMKRISNDVESTYITVSMEQDQSFGKDYQVGKYVACMYDQEWYIGTIDDRSEVHNDVLINFMKKMRTGLFFMAANFAEGSMLGAIPTCDLCD